MSTPTDNPYVGPRTFTRDKSSLFFGREQEAKDLLAVVLTNRLTLFYAQSGAGKSSLLNARLIPALTEQENFLVLPVGRVSGKLPQGIEQVDNIFVFNLLVSLDQSDASPERLTHLTIPEFLANLATEDGEHYFYSPEEAGDGAAGDGAAGDGAAGDETPEEEPTPVPHILIIDQFEEILTTNLERWAEREAFFAQLNKAMAAEPMLWVLLTLREDFVAALRPYARLIENNMRARYYMQRMEETAARQAIEEPAKLGGRPFASGVAQILVENLRQIKVQGQEESQPGQFIEPVQLQVVCFQLWQGLAGTDKPEITQKDLEEVGDVDRALASFYEDALANAIHQTGISEISLRDWFDQELITEAETRGTVYQGQTETAGMSNEVVAVLAAQYLLRAEIRAGGTWYELVHDRFVAPILQANQAWRLQQSPLIRAAQEWARSDWSRDKLYKDDQLQAALGSVDLATAEPVVRDFLQTSQDAQSQRDLAEAQKKAAAEARIARRLRLLTIGLAIAITVAVVFAVVAYRQRNIAEDKAAEAIENAERAADNELAALVNSRRADTNAAAAIANEARAEAKAEEASEANEKAARLLTELKIQPTVLDYFFGDAITEAAASLQANGVETAPELVVASTMLNLAFFGNFYPEGGVSDVVVRQTATALDILDKATDLEPGYDKERQPNLAQLYLKMCRPILLESVAPEDIPALRTACSQAIGLADQLEDAAISLQVCSLIGAKELNQLQQAQATAVCNEVSKQASPIAIGETISGTIKPGRSHVYVFSSSDDQTMYIFMRTNNSTLDSFLELYTESGRLRYSDDQSGTLNNALLGPISEEGKYFIIARGYNVEAEGDYLITLANQRPDVYAILAQGSLAPGQPITSTIEVEETELWSFTGEAGQNILIRMAANNSNLDSLLTLLGPENSYLAEDNNSGGDLDASVSVTLPLSGTYLLIVRDTDQKNGEGAYTLLIEEILVEASSALTQESILMGELLVGLPDSAFLGLSERHLRTFAGEGEQTISLAMVADNSPLDGYLRLFDPEGTLVAEDDDSFGNFNPFLTAVLPTTGTYSVIASGFNESSSGAYLLELSDGSAEFSFGSGSLSPPPIVIDDSFSGAMVMGQITPDQPISGTIRPGERQFWTFNGTVSETVSILMSARNSPLDSMLELVDPNGNIVIQDDDSGGNGNALIQAYTLPATGIYTIIARGFADSAGDYDLLLSFDTADTRVPMPERTSTKNSGGQQ